MKRCFALAVLCVLCAALLPLYFGAPSAESESPPVTEPASDPLRLDGTRTLRLLANGETRELTLAEYLPGVVAAEMPASFDPEALRSQAVAARTYTLYQMQNGRGRHSYADVCADPGCCQAWLRPEELAARWGAENDRWSEAIRQAVEDTDGVILQWEDAPILACFHASSAGSTESSAALWGTALPYLVCVPSPETAADVPGFVSVSECSAAELRAHVLALAPAAALDGPPEQWVGESVLDAGGRVSSIRIGGVPVNGERLRASFSLRSTAFTLSWTDERFRFTVTGNGHGVGLSQYGANVMAGDGFSWQEILRHYYPGAELGKLS